jgi:hypothetical protein
MISDLNFDPSDEENYTTEEPSGSSFFVGIFLNYDQSNSYPNQIQNTISNFNQGGYYTNYLMIVVFIHIRIHLFINNRTQRCH